jgi:hypothetical protein
MNPPSGRRPQVFVVVPQMPDQIGDLISCNGPVVRDAGDPAQRVVGTLTGRVHLADDRVLGAGDLGWVRQARHRRPDTVAAMMAAYGLQRARWLRKSQFGCVREQFDHVIETPVIDGRCVEMNQIG